MFTRDQYALITRALDVLALADPTEHGVVDLARRCRAAAASGETLHAPHGEAPMRCPECGNDDPDELLWLEDVPTSRTVHGVRADGTIVIDDIDDIDGEREYEGAHTQRFRCLRYIGPGRQCLTEWPTPADGIDYAGELFDHKVPPEPVCCPVNAPACEGGDDQSHDACEPPAKKEESGHSWCAVCADPFCCAEWHAKDAPDNAAPAQGWCERCREPGDQLVCDRCRELDGDDGGQQVVS